MPLIVEVLLPRPIAHPFHYLVPDAWQAQARPGVRAVVPFGHELLTGLIVETAAPPPLHAAGKLRSVHALLDERPLLTPDLLTLLRRSADYYAVPWGDLLRSAIPPPLLPTGERRYRRTETPGRAALRGRLARQLVEIIGKRAKGVSHHTLLLRMKKCGISAARLQATLRRLAGAGWVLVEWSLNSKLADKNAKNSINNSTLYHKIAINKHLISHFNSNEFLALAKCINYNEFNVLVNNCPGGSENHFSALADLAAEAGHSVLLLTPEIARAEQLAADMQARLHWPVTHLHSDPVPRARQWLALRDAAGPQILVGGRSALFAPIHGLGLILIDEEADPLYKQEERPRLHVRDIAILRAQQARIPIVLSGRFISVETYWQAQQGKYRWLTPPATTPSGAPAEHVHFPPDRAIRLIDLRSERLLDGLLTGPLIEQITQRLADGEQALLFVNRRGYAHGLVCRDCGDVVRCPTCRAALRYRKTDANLQCRYCGAETAAPTLCPACRGHRMSPLGTGTQRVEEALRRHWPEARITRVDRDAPNTDDNVDQEPAQLLIGTQLCLHRPPPDRLGLVAVLDAELDLSRPDFRAEERALQLLIRLQGLLQPAVPGALLLVQSRQPDRPALQALLANAPSRFYEAELAQRKTLGYPPLTRLATVHGRGQPDRLAQQIRTLTESAKVQGEVWGPIPVSARRRGLPDWELLLKAPTPAALRKVVGAVRTLPLTVRLERQGALQIEVDPV